MIATRIRDYGPNFALYRINKEDAAQCNVLEFGGSRRVQLPTSCDIIIAVREINFVGLAKGKTGAHRLNETNTEEIEVELLRVDEAGKVIAGKWSLVNQDELDRLYQQRLFNNGATAGNCW